MSDDSTAEKATDRLEKALDPDKGENWTRLVGDEIDDLRTVIVDAREVESLREQLAERTKDWHDSVHDGVELLTLLVEAQATIEKALKAYKDGPIAFDQGFKIAMEMFNILSAPSSTGGGDDWVDPEPWWYPNSHMRTAHKLPQTTAEYHPRNREQWEAEGGNDHE